MPKVPCSTKGLFHCRSYGDDGKYEFQGSAQDWRDQKGGSLAFTYISPEHDCSRTSYIQLGCQSISMIEFYSSVYFDTCPSVLRVPGISERWFAQGCGMVLDCFLARGATAHALTHLECMSYLSSEASQDLGNAFERCAPAHLTGFKLHLAIFDGTRLK